MTVLGIDPGLDGGFALLQDGEEPFVRPTPTVVVRATRRAYCGASMRLLLKHAALIDLAVIERQQAFPRQGGVSNFSTGYGFGLWSGMLTMLQVPTEIVAVKDWQRAFGLRGGNKAASVLVAQRLFPGVDLLATERSRKPHDGMAEALLLAEFGRRLRA